MRIEVSTGILVKPTCAHCGYQVPGDCMIGSGCPNCHQRIYPAALPSSPPVPVIAAGAGAEELQAKDAELAALRARVGELEAGRG
jgi:hypothetical protein